MRVISAGDGYRYLLKSVAAGDAGRSLSTPLTRYYVQAGTPPGWWLGSGLPGLAESGDPDTAIVAGDVVTEEQLRLLLGEGRNPGTGMPLGRAYPRYDSAVAEDGGRRRAVAGYDYTFSVPKSVSTLWALADADIPERIVAAHHAAVRDVVALLENQVAATRAGVAGGDGGAVAQVPVHGVLASAFDHVDSRAGDPQLHTHLVISNKVQAVFDGRWRSLDSRPMHAATVALSEHYNAVLADRLAQHLGVGWEQRPRGRDRNPAWEITGVPDALIEEFSTRGRGIETVTDELIDDYRQRHGHAPSRTAIVKLRQQATLATRPDKDVRSLAELSEEWRMRATRLLGADATAWARDLVHASAATPRRAGVRPATLTAGQLSNGDVASLAKQVVQTVGERRATWRYWNLHAEASRQTMHLRCATASDRADLVARVADAAVAASVRLSPDEPATTPARFLRPDGTSMFRPRHHALYTSAELWEAEARLLGHGRQADAPAVPADIVDRVREGSGRGLGADQQAAVHKIATSGRRIDELVGPAGTGKTTTMRALRDVWETQHGTGSVVGLAPSASAAEVLGDELGIGAENTAKWLFEHRSGRWNLCVGQLVILDEASLAGTFTLDAITTHAAEAGAKVLLVGDPSQLDAVDAGGGFSLLVTDRREHDEPVPELTGVRRFRHDWEKDASLRLRDGDVGVVDVYETHGRIRDGESELMVDAAYRGWVADLAEGRTSSMVAESHETVTALNERARADRIATGHVDPDRAVRLHDGTRASPGDVVVVTRRNNRRLVAGRRWVQNGDRWQITNLRADGSVRLRRINCNGRLGASVVLPADYAAAHVELGYAATVHRAEGATVDTAHLLVQSTSMTREALYVGMTRGRHANTAYVATDSPDLEAHQHDPTEPATAQVVLAAVLKHVGAEASAHETKVTEHERYATIAQLAAEYDTIAAAAQRPRWTRLLTDAGLTAEQVDEVLGSDAYGPLAAALRRAEADGHDPQEVLTSAVARHGFDDADEIAAVLHHRIQNATARPPSAQQRKQRPRLIAGLIPEAAGPMSEDIDQALTDRARLIEQHADDLVNEAVRNGSRWIRSLGTPPNDALHRHQWLQQVRTLAAYRDPLQDWHNPTPRPRTDDGRAAPRIRTRPCRHAPSAAGERTCRRISPTGSTHASAGTLTDRRPSQGPRRPRCPSGGLTARVPPFAPAAPS